MSSVERVVRPTEAALTEEFTEAVDDARERIAAVLNPACPTPAFLTALREEVERAIADPASVPYPELADADAYWNATVKPQNRSVRESVNAIVEWLEQRVITTMEVAERDLKALVDAAAAEPGPDPAALRELVKAEIETRCLDLHHQMGQVLTVLPSGEVVEDARAHAADEIRSQASHDVSSLKEAYLRDAGGDEAHQTFAEQQWSETFAERVAHRQSMLAAYPPWRHQEFALVGYERARAEAEATIEAAAARLQSPLMAMQTVLLSRYDDAVAGAQA